MHTNKLLPILCLSLSATLFAQNAQEYVHAAFAKERAEGIAEKIEHTQIKTQVGVAKAVGGLISFGIGFYIWPQDDAKTTVSTACASILHCLGLAFMAFGANDIIDSQIKRHTLEKRPTACTEQSS